MLTLWRSISVSVWMSDPFDMDPRSLGCLVDVLSPRELSLGRVGGKLCQISFGQSVQRLVFRRERELALERVYNMSAASNAPSHQKSDVTFQCQEIAMWR